jgi:hypothetical protein
MLWTMVGGGGGVEMAGAGRDAVKGAVDVRDKWLRRDSRRVIEFGRRGKERWGIKLFGKVGVIEGRSDVWKWSVTLDVS